jgi:hypothetical protein
MAFEPFHWTCPHCGREPLSLSTTSRAELKDSKSNRATGKHISPTGASLARAQRAVGTSSLRPSPGQGAIGLPATACGSTRHR